MSDKKEVKTKKSASKKRVSPLKKFRQFVISDKVRRITGLLTLLFSFYLLVAFTSFLFTWKLDQDLLFGSWGELFSNPEIEVANWLGKLGALTSHIFINNWFGISSFAFIIILALLGLKILLNISLLPLAKTIKNTLFLIIWFSALMGFFFDSDYLFVGGSIGFYINQWSVATLGSAGTISLLTVVFLSYLIISFDLSIRSIYQFIKKYTSSPEVNEEIEAPASFSNINPANLEKELNDETSLKEELFYTEEKKEEELEPEIKATTTETNDAEHLLSVENLAAEKEPELTGTSEMEITIPEPEPTIEDIKADSEEEGLELDVTVAENSDEELSKSEINQKVKDFGEYDPTLDLSKFKFPSIDLLANHGDGQIEVNKEELEVNKNNIVNTLQNYKIEIDQIKATIGPTVTLYEIVPAPGVRISKIKNLEDDIALSLAALGIRIIAPIPGKGTIGIEVPNQNPGIVSMKAVIASDKFQNSDMEIPLAIGKTISNETFVTDLTKMPHLLMAGATGQGKSVGLNAILVSVLYKKHPSQVKFVLVDPKKVELTLFNKIERHYLAKLPDEAEAIITDTSKVVATLNSLCIEMDQRYELLKEAHCRNIKEYNKKFVNRKLNPENGHRYLPYIIVVVDEFADLIMTAGKEVETPIARIAQLARAIGIHLIIATQRPSVNIITGTIKANFPSRIAFRVTSKIDSRTILDAGGADQLIGRGDLLFTSGNDLTRVQCAFVDTPEVEEITDFIGNQQGYPDAFLLPEYVGDVDNQSDGLDDEDDRDVLFVDAAKVVVMHQQGSASLLQRKLKLGYNRAGRIVDQLESAGIIGPFKGSKAREVLIPDEISLEQLLNRSNENEL
ncbi:MAG: DNA translocase FtsK 4TM domain-containing protein [Salibacteraceae bacterium]